MQQTATSKPALSTQLQAHLELADPITWVAAIAMVFCGALASSQGTPGFDPTNLNHLLLAGLAALMCGPFGTGFSQSINDYYDRDLDAINDPARPIPSGRVSLAAARANWMVLGLGTMLIGLFLARYSLWIPIFALLSLILSVLYSMPPIKLKQNFWFGPPAVGVGYILLTWLVGHLLFGQLTWPSLILALINSALAAGLLFLNDIKSVEGDRQLGLKSLTVALGVRQTLVVAYTIIDLCLVAMLVLALWGGYLWAAGFVALALLAPIPFQIRLFRDPTHTNFKYFLLVNNPFVLLLELFSAFIVGGYFG
ncbi:bacteriochlorophyll/chlorophyll synthetase [Oscillochloris trichoides DG-6]|uniref:Bacteriochlorophyll/chlorophyll synthetase n=1 Tax=Oscillochloris trichoides DG-6 TaxID=765420 RepID=E1IGB8_9CHLR|nr:(bacterio)chlorophyll synthase [Oscillochloris trichoides]EFO79771.1 bacteriochlorophyll/chlorophyll synthetase [Oscillochloris trichoides DG-6]